MLRPRRIENFLGQLGGPENRTPGRRAEGGPRSAALNPWHADRRGAALDLGRHVGVQRCTPVAAHISKCTDISLVFYMSLT